MQTLYSTFGSEDTWNLGYDGLAWMMGDEDEARRRNEAKVGWEIRLQVDGDG